MAIALLCELRGAGGFKKDVVAKFIRPEHVDNEAYVRMFLDEARNAATLSHANIAQVFEVDYLERFPYMIMEYVQGPTLSLLVQRGNRVGYLHHGHIAYALSQICRGLQCAHDAGVVHRDVTPHNVLVSATGEVKLIDFGIAKSQGRLEETRNGILKGKLHYIPPEILKRERADHRVDVYAVGISLYRMTVGQYPFRGGDQGATLSDILRGDPIQPSLLRGGYPQELEDIVMCALSADPEARFSSASDLADALEAFSGKGRWSCDQQGLSRLIHRLFPSGEEDWLDQHTESTSSDSLFATMESAPVEPPTRPRWMAPIAALAGLLAVAAVGSTVALTLTAGAPQAPASAQQPEVEIAVRARLDEVERLLLAGDVTTAERLLDQVDLITFGDTVLHVRAEALHMQIQQARANATGTAGEAPEAPEADPERAPPSEAPEGDAEPAPRDGGSPPTAEDPPVDPDNPRQVRLEFPR